MSVTIDDLDNADAAAEMFDQTVDAALEERQEDTLSKAAAMEAKERLEQGAEDAKSEPVLVDVAGEQIAMEPLDGLGQKTRLAREMVEAERKEDDLDMMVAVDGMIQLLADRTVHDDVFDRAFWDERDRETIQTAFSDLGQKSVGGQAAGNS
jgi:hypothetical protein